MKWALLVLLFPLIAFADEAYIDIGIGYKVQEAKIYNYNNTSPTAHIAIGYKWDSVSLELSHDSNYFSGPPFNKDWEYYRTEVRVVKRYSWSM